MTNLEIRRLTADDPDIGADQVAASIARAFARLEVAEWLVPDPADRVTMLTGQFAMLVARALDQGEVLLGSRGPASSGGVSAAAVWYHELAGPHALPDDYDARLEEICGVHVNRFRVLDEAFAACHPDDHPYHYYLTHLATLPEHQGCGLGTALLRHTLDRVDRDQAPAYLVASNTRTRDWYARHGYERIEGGPLRLPDGLQMWPMWREPRPLAVRVASEHLTGQAEAAAPMIVDHRDTAPGHGPS